MTVDDVLPLPIPLDTFRGYDDENLIEVRTPFAEFTLFFVPREELIPAGVARGRCWTADELTRYLTLKTRTPEVARALITAKMAFDASLDEVIDDVVQPIAVAAPPPPAPAQDDFMAGTPPSTNPSLAWRSAPWAKRRA